MAEAAQARYRASDLEAFGARLFSAAGLSERDARTVGRSLVRSELRGWRTHGLSRVKSYVEMLQEGLFNTGPTITHSRLSGALVVDCDRAMGQVAAREVLDLARKDMEGTASLLVVARDIGHLGALGVHVLEAAEAGLFCMAGQNTPALVAMEGFHRGAIGNNPLAFACPAPGAGEPIVFDMACSQAARGHLLLAARDGQAIPQGWAVDREGRSTTDPKLALEGALLPVGGAKGIGIAMMVQVLAGALSATAGSVLRPPPMLRPSGGTTATGAFFWFIDPSAFGGRAAFDESMRQWLAHYEGSAPAGIARVPGVRRGALEADGTRAGLGLSPSVDLELQAVARKFDVDFPAPLS